MRDADLLVLEKVYDALALYLSKSHASLLAEFFDTYVYLSGKHEKQKASYRKKAQYHRDKSKQWRQENPERSKKHSADYQARKKRKTK